MGARDLDIEAPQAGPEVSEPPAAIEGAEDTCKPAEQTPPLRDEQPPGSDDQRQAISGYRDRPPLGVPGPVPPPRETQRP